MATEKYTQIYVLINGALLLEHTSVTITRMSGSSAVTTVGRGYAGESIGAPILEADVENAIPIAGLEFDAGRFIKTLEVVEIGFMGGPLVETSKGFIIQDSVRGSANSPSGYSFKFRGNFAEFQ